MSIEIKIYGENAAEALEELRGLAALTGSSPQPIPVAAETPEPAKSDKPSRSRSTTKKTEEPAAAAKPETEQTVDTDQDAPTNTDATDTGATDGEDRPAFKLEDVRAKLAELSRAGKQPEVKALLKKFGSDNLTGLDPAKYAEVMAAAEKLG